MEASNPYADLRPLLVKYGPEPLFTQIGSLCAEAATAKEATTEDAALWECAAEAAESAAASLRDGAEDDSNDEEAEDEEQDEETEDRETSGEGEDESMPDESETAPPDAGDEKTAAAPAAPAAAPKARREEPMKMRDKRIGPWPADTTHWRGRLCDAQGKYTRGGKWLSAYDDGIEVFEFPIKALSIETLCALGKTIGDFWVIAEYYRLDERGRMPRGRSRALHIVTPEAARKAKAESSTPPAPPMPLAMPSGGSDATFAHMLSLLAFMQERDERSRAAAREEARVAHERYVADIELLKERERLATQRQIAEMESKAKIEAHVLGRAARVSGAGFDRDALRELLREELDDRLPDPEPPAPVVTPAKGGMDRLADTINTLLTQVGPLLAHRYLPALPSAPNPANGAS